MCGGLGKQIKYNTQLEPLCYSLEERWEWGEKTKTGILSIEISSEDVNSTSVYFPTRKIVIN